MTFTALSGLDELAFAFKLKTGNEISPFEMAYLVRQIHIGHGCIHKCNHCFAVPPSTLEQMNLSSFTQLAGEFGMAAQKVGKIFPFLFLGSASDPSMIVDFYKYAEAWLCSLPVWHPVKFYTHGWIQTNEAQKKEFTAFINVVHKYAHRITTLALSVDMFSLFARQNWKSYLSNASVNLRELSQAGNDQSLMLHVSYPPCRLDMKEEYAINYWRYLATNNEAFPSDQEIDDILSRAVTKPERDCAQLTSGLFTIGEMAGLTRRQIALMSRDNGTPLPSGRAKSFYTNSLKKVEADRALQRYEQHALKSLHSFSLGYQGVMIMPNGTVQLIDYLGYKPGDWLNNHQKTITYLSSFMRNDLPWELSDLGYKKADKNAKQ